MQISTCSPHWGGELRQELAGSPPHQTHGNLKRILSVGPQEIAAHKTEVHRESAGWTWLCASGHLSLCTVALYVLDRFSHGPRLPTAIRLWGGLSEVSPVCWGAVAKPRGRAIPI